MRSSGDLSAPTSKNRNCCRLFALALPLVLCLGVQFARADNPPARKTIVISNIEAARILIAIGRLEDARRLLRSRTQSGQNEIERLFLLGTIAVVEKNYDLAISYFRRILVIEPNAERVRLDLARAFFLKGDYDNATIQFRRARAGNVPDAVKANIDHYLAAMARGKKWSYGFSVALAPDTDENAATSVDQVTIYGLPFTLDSKARQTSGVGVFGEVYGEWSPTIAKNLKARIGIDAYRTDYSGGSFDDMTASVYAGPQLFFDGWDISPLFTGFDRWFGNKPYLDGRGGRLVADFGTTSPWQWSLSLGGQNLEFKPNPLQSGPLYSLQAQAGHVLSPSDAMEILAGFNRQDADPSFSYSGYWFGAGYQRDLPLGFSAKISPAYFVTDYDSPLAGFGVARSDHMLVVQLDFLNRRFAYRGFTPKFFYTFTDQQSNIPLFRYTRSQFQLGLTTQF